MATDLSAFVNPLSLVNSFSSSQKVNQNTADPKVFAKMYEGIVALQSQTMQNQGTDILLSDGNGGGGDGGSALSSLMNNQGSTPGSIPSASGAINPAQIYGNFLGQDISYMVQENGKSVSKTGHVVGVSQQQDGNYYFNLESGESIKAVFAGSAAAAANAPVADSSSVVSNSNSDRSDNAVNPVIAAG